MSDHNEDATDLECAQIAAELLQLSLRTAKTMGACPACVMQVMHGIIATIPVEALHEMHQHGTIPTIQIEESELIDFETIGGPQ